MTSAQAADGAKPDFDDHAWVRKRGPFQGGAGMTITNPGLGQFDETMDLRLQHAFYRAGFLVTDPAKARGLSLSVVYTGGVRVFLNGSEIARGHLPAGTLAADTPATPYPAAAYQPDGVSLRQRKLEGIAIAPENLRPGVNVLGGLLCVPLAQGPRRGLLALQNESGSRVTPPELWFWPARNGVWSSPAIAEGKVFFMDGKRGDAGRCFHCLEVKTGAACWQTPVVADASGEFVLADGFVLVQAQTEALSDFDFGGRLIWRADLGELCGPPATRDQLVAVALAAPPSVVVLDLPTGVTLWQRNLVPTTGAVFARDLVLVGTAAGVTALRLTDGSLAWEAPVGKPVQPLLLLDNVVATTTEASELVQVEISTGVVTAKLPGASVQFPPVLTRDAILFAGKDGFYRAALDSTVARRWLATGGLGEMTSPPIMADSAVYFATATKGFIKAGRLE
jgi:outer membrane protein assembly factor BamB